ncbi:MAG: LamG domain-containing protein [Candidatus Pacebacteria bacterium]|nr:LamG domain-containing protein [Candidatus Paceibacterota bacterium]
MKNRNLENIRSATLIEILMYVALAAISVTTASLTLYSYESSLSVNNEAAQLLDDIREAQQKAITQEEGSNWGIYLNAAADAVDSYSIFYGDSYAAGTVTYMATFAPRVRFSDPAEGSTKEIIFAKETGVLTSGDTKTITLTLLNGPSVYKVISINSAGLISYSDLAPPTNGLVGWWKFEEGAGSTVLDYSEGGNDGTWAGTGTHYATGQVGNFTGQFNGTSDVVSVPSSESLRITDAITMLAWIKPGSFSQTGTYQHIFMKTGTTPYMLYLRHPNASGNLYLTLKIPTEQTMSNFTITQDVWQFVAFTYDSAGGTNNSKSYLNGSLKSQSTKTGTINDVGTNNLGIGAYPAGGEYWYGSIDEVAIYNRALEADEIEEIYSRQQ